MPVKSLPNYEMQIGGVTQGMTIKNRCLHRIQNDYGEGGTL